MARIRTLKPEFWDHEQLGRMSPLARLTFVGLISLADDEGRGKAEMGHLWGRLHGYTPLNVKARWASVMGELKAVKDDDGPLVIFYKVAGSSYYWLPGFCRQQRIDKPQPSKLPPPPNSKNGKGPSDDGSTLEGIKDQGSRRGGDQGGIPAPPPSPPPPEVHPREPVKTPKFSL